MPPKNPRRKPDPADKPAPKPRRRSAPKPGAVDAPAAPAGEVKLLTGGNPQIAKGHGDAPVQAYIAAMPGWKRAVGQKLDAIITRTVPNLRKAVKWNSPMYGEGPTDNIWFLGIHCCAKYVKVAFFSGAQLQPKPPVESKLPAVRYFHIYENDTLDEKQFADWVLQASRLPGQKM